MEKIIIDVDTGIDDALAILYAVQSKELDIVGITTVCGNVPVDLVTVNTKKVLKLLDSNIKVYKGASQPLLREPFYEFRVHGENGIGGTLNDIEVPLDIEELSAVDFIIEKAKQLKGELSIVTVAPLTNLALAIRKEPEIVRWIKQVVIMGGLVSEAGTGNTLPTSEFNIFADAEAAKIVFHSGIPMTLVSLDVTRKVMLTEHHIEQLKGSRFYEFVKDSTEVFRTFTYENYGENGCALHDPLAVAVLIDESLVKTKEVYVDVETKSEISYGQTICDFQNLLGKEPNMKICLDVNHETFLQRFIEYLKR